MRCRRTFWDIEKGSACFQRASASGQNLKQQAGLDLPADQAIVWATERTHTTRKGNVPGGLGLKLLREFIRLNEGKIQIVSDVGYWQQNGSDSRTAILPHAFPGTVVNIEINTADNRSYRLASEVKLDDIFQLNMKE